MHSSRMRTSHSLNVCCSVLLAGGFSLVRGGLLGPGGSPWSWGVLLCPRGVSLVWGGSPWSWGVLLCPRGFSFILGAFSLVRGGLLGPGGSPWSGGVLLCPGGFSLVRGVSPETPPVDRITDTCKNITLVTTSLWPVKSHEINSHDAHSVTSTPSTCSEPGADPGSKGVPF